MFYTSFSGWQWWIVWLGEPGVWFIGGWMAYEVKEDSNADCLGEARKGGPGKGAGSRF